MNKWVIKYWSPDIGKNPIEKWLDKLTKDQFKSVVKEIIMLEKVGNELKLPHSKALSKGLFELRERRFGFRIYYFFSEKEIIIVVGAGDKKTQKIDIKLAYERISNFKKGNNENKKF